MARTSVQEILEGSMEKIHHSPSEWMKFLGFHAKFHRYNTINAALIYAQRPDATACASMNFWNNRLNRWIKRGSHGIRVLQPDGASVRYVFDVADTTGDPGTHPHIWQVSERELPIFLDYLNAPEAGSVQGRIQKLVHEITEALLPEIMDDVQLNRQDTLLEELDELNLKVTCRDLISSSAAYMTMKRLGVSPEDVLIEEDFRGVVDFSSPALQTVLDVHVHEISKQVLDTFELCTRHRQEILAERERFSEVFSKNGAEPPLQEPTFTQRYRQEEEIKEGTEHDPQVRNDAQNLSGGTQARGVRPTAADGQTERPSGGSGHASQDAGAGADRTSPEGTSSARHEQSAGMGAAHEQPEAHGGGSGAEAAGLRLIEGGQGKSPQQVHTTKPREPNKKSGSFSMPDSGQISMFAMPAAEQPEGQFHIGKQYISQDEIDLVLRCGSNEPQSPLRICAKFRWDKPLEENADFLRREFRLDGRGFIINDRQLAAWFDQDGIHLARGNSAQLPSAHVITWSEAAKRIRELLDEGKYVSQPELDYSQYYERKRLGERIWHAYRDDLGGLPKEIGLPSGFPDAAAKLTDMLGNPEEYSQLSEHLEKRIQKQADQPHRRGYRERIPQLLQDVKELQREPLSFHSDMLDEVQYKRFITADEIDDVLRRDHTSGSGQRIQAYFRESHTDQEKEQFLRKSYGIGGHGSAALHYDYDSRGLSISRDSVRNPEAKVSLKWKQVAARIQTLIEEGRYWKGELPREPVPAEVVEAIAEAPEKKYDLDFVHAENGLKAVNRVNDEKVAQINADGTIQYTDPNMPVEQIDRITKKAEIYWNDIGLNEQSEDSRSPDSENPSEDGQQSKLESQTVAFYAAEETHLPYDVEIRTIRTVEPVKEVPEIPVANYRIHDDHLGEGGARTKADRNIEAIRLLKRIEGENRSATVEEQEALAQYVGWGGIPQIFDGQNADWKDRYEALKEVLTDTEYASARASTLNAHYTSPVVIRSIYQALENMGFRTGNVLEIKFLYLIQQNETQIAA